MFELLKKSFRVLRTQGVRVFVRKSLEYSKNRKLYRKYNIKNIAGCENFMDALFINGCYLPHPSRYRVTHQREQLLANNFITNEVFYTDIDLEMIKYYRMFIFFRCPHTDLIEKFIIEAKSHNKVVYYDIDDLVIDLKYTDTVKYLDTMSADKRTEYDDGVLRMQKVLKMCDGAITSTEALADELGQYVPEVFINRNTASDSMVKFSERAIYNRDILPFKTRDMLNKSDKRFQKRFKRISDKRINVGKTRIGYFSGSITHNDDIIMILPVISEIMSKFDNVEFHFIGELDIPEDLKIFKDRIFSSKFVDWWKLPELIASVDINISPLEDSIFNRAKSEIKWIEAALVKVPTIASNIGAFAKMIENNKTGILCSNNEEWVCAFELLINNKNVRLEIAENAYKFVNKNCCTLFTGLPLTNYLRNKMTPNVAFILPSAQISGGALVVLKHCLILKQVGYDVFIINDNFESKNIKFEEKYIYLISNRFIGFHGRIDKAVSTLWTTLSFSINYANIKTRYYLVQNFETNFYEPGISYKFGANQTYSSIVPVNYITISKWCENWLIDDYNQKPKYAPNGIDTSKFKPKKREFNSDKKIRVLVEGNSNDYYKNVDESFEIVSKLDKDKYEIWFMSYLGKPRKWYRVDKFLHKIPYEKVPKVYQDCDILLKSSILESFSYPPLEMMSTGGFVVVAPNEGNIEYLQHEKNCLLYEQGNVYSAVKAIERICSDKLLRDDLYNGGLETSKKRDWNIVYNAILSLYED